MLKYDEYIHYGQVKHAEEFQRVPVKLKEIALIASVITKVLFNETLSTTSIYRKKTTDSGIHEALRAIDFKPLSKPEYTYFLIEKINQIYVYDPDRPTLKVAHENPYHGTAQHIHIQCHDKTTCLTKDRIDYFQLLAKNHELHFKGLA